MEDKRKSFDATKPVRTVKGEPARIICTDRASMNGLSVVALVPAALGEYTMFVTPRGTDNVDTPVLENVPEKRYVNLYRDTAGLLYLGMENAKPSEGFVRKGHTFVLTIEVEAS